MPSTYTKNLGLEKPATGEQAGTWGNTANSDYDYLDDATDGNLHIILSAGAYTLSTTQATNCEGRKKVIIWSGGTTPNTTVNITPNTAQKLYMMTNSSSVTLQFQQGTGGSYTLEPGWSSIIYCDGAGSSARVDGALLNPKFGSVYVSQNLTVNGNASFNLPVTFSRQVQFNDSVLINNSLSVTNGYFKYDVLGFGNSAGDVYYRHPTGAIIPLPIGAPGQLLQAQSGAVIAWATVQLAIGSSVSGSLPYRIYYSDASNFLDQDGSIMINPGIGIGIGTLPQHSLHIGVGLAPHIWLDTPNTVSLARSLLLATNSVPRWNLYTPQESEAGANTGSNLALVGYNDSGAALVNAICFFRANGNVAIGAYGDFGARLTVISTNTGQPAVLVRGASGQTAVLQSWQNSAGTTVGSIDNTGRMVLAGTQFIQLDPVYGALDLHGSVTGHPWGCIHVGQENAVLGTGGPALRTIGLRGSIAFENASSGSDPVPDGICRIYFRGLRFVIQYRVSGQQYSAYLDLVASPGGGPAGWAYAPGVV
jgi:hypothetical protein